MSATTPLFEEAPAKINLALHITGQRSDGYHLLESLVAFTVLGDRLSFTPAAADSLTITGPFAPSLLGESKANLVERARDLLRSKAEALGHACPPVAIHLEKHLPVASGIGGGSADAAAALRGLSRLWTIPRALSEDLALSLGADVPMCLISRSLIARGIGENLSAVDLPELPLLLVNPMVPVSTPEIFRRLTTKTNPPLPTADGNWLSLLPQLRNDLQAPAISLVSSIGTVISALERAGSVVARMSGSGATCFGLYGSAEEAEAAAEVIRAAHPDWFVAATITRIA